jgi:hypothetical protein
VGLLKKAHLLRCAANRTAQRMSIRVTFRLYASWFGFLRALHLNIRVTFRLFEQPQNMGFSTDPLSPIFLYFSIFRKNADSIRIFKIVVKLHTSSF